jgi:hypothetical protein
MWFSHTESHFRLGTVLLLAIAGYCAACTPSTMVVRGVLEGPGDDVSLTIPDQPRPRPRLLMDEDASILLNRLRIETVRTGAAPGEGYTLATFSHPRPTVSGGGGLIDVASAGDTDWMRQHTGDLLLGSFFWYEDPADAGVSVDAEADAQAGATYLVRFETDDASRHTIRWNAPGAVPLPESMARGRGSEPDELDDFPDLQDEVQTCIDEVLADAEANPPLTPAEQQALIRRRLDCRATPEEVAEAYGRTCVGRPCLDMRNLSLAFFAAISAAFEEAVEDIDDVELGGPDGEGSFEMSYVPHVRGNDGFQGFAYIFEGTIDGPLGVSVVVSIPISVYLVPVEFEPTPQGLVSRTYEPEFDPLEGLNPLNLDRIVVRRTAPVGVSWFVDPEPIRQQIIDGIVGADDFAEALDAFRLLLKIEIIRTRKRGELLGPEITPIIPEDFGIVVLPDLPSDGTHGTRIMPEAGGARIALNFLE